MALVTGSSGGLGSAIVLELKRKGCRVVAVDLAEESDLESDPSYMYIKADVSSIDQIKKLPGKIKDRYGQEATIIISNAGIMIGHRILDFEDGQFEQ